MCDVPSIAVFCSECIECFLGTASKFFLKLLVAIPVAPFIIGIIVHFKFHIRCISIRKLLYFNFFSASFCTTFLSAGIATSIYLSIYYYYYCSSSSSNKNNTRNIFLLQRLVGFQAVKKFSSFCITRMFITVCTKGLQIFRYLSQINSFHAISSCFLKMRFNIVRSSTRTCIIVCSSTRMPSRRSLSFTLLQQNPICMCFFSPSCVAHAQLFGCI